MFLRFRYRLGFETLCGEVTDSLTWRRFCRIGLTDAVPDPSTLMKITTRCGDARVAALNQRLLEKANAAHLIKVDKVRADTTVIPANVAYPTDSGLLTKGVAKLTQDGWGNQGSRAGSQNPLSRPHPLGPSAGSSDRGLVASAQRRGQRRGADSDRRVGHHCRGNHQRGPDCRHNARRGLRRAGARSSGKAASLVSELERTIGVLEQIVAQTRTRLAGEIPDGASRVVSLHDTEARPIAKGRLGRPVEFGFKGQVVDNPDGIVLDHCVAMGNPANAPNCWRPPSPASRNSSPRCPRRPPPTGAMARPRSKPSSMNSVSSMSPSRARVAPAQRVKRSSPRVASAS